jgi:hypothetical protein
MYIGKQSTIKYLSALTRNYVIDRKNECGFVTKITAEVTSLYSMVHQVFFLRRRLAKISDEAEKNSDFFRTK